MGENQSLRRENGDLFSVRDMMLRFYSILFLTMKTFNMKSIALLFRDQELVCRENERLLKKLEDVNS